jgi:hypothetical protein
VSQITKIYGTKSPKRKHYVVKFISAKIKQNQNSHRWKNYNGRKIWTVDAGDVEYITV